MPVSVTIRFVRYEVGNCMMAVFRCVRGRDGKRIVVFAELIAAVAQDFERGLVVRQSYWAAGPEPG